MGTWTNQIEAKAELIHEQMQLVRQLATKHGGDIGSVSRPYLDLLRSLYEEEFPFAKLVDESDLVVRFEGPAVSVENPSFGLVTYVITDLRLQVRSIARSIVGLSRDSNAKWPSELDPDLSGLTKGSLIVGVKVPSPGEAHAKGQLSMPGFSDQAYAAVRNAVRSLAIVARHVDETHVDEAIRDDFQDPAIRDAVMVAASRLAPTGRKGIDQVSLIGTDTDAVSPPLTPRSRVILTQALGKPVKQTGRGSFQGVVREIDLDAKRFEIRNVPQIGTIRCVYPQLAPASAIALLDTYVRVSGSYETLPNQLPRLLSVENVAPVEGQGHQLRFDSPSEN